MREHINRAAVLLLVVGLGFAQPLAVAAQSGAAASGSWTIDPARSEVRFTVTKLGFEDVTGVFRESSGIVTYDHANPTASRVSWRVRVASVVSGATNRDRTLQSREYFHAAEHPELVFESDTVRAQPDGTLSVDGRITIRGATRPLTVIVRPNWRGPSPTFQAQFELDRYDFGITGGLVLGRIIGRRVRVHLVAATHPMPPAAVQALR